nr:hypothetical protein [Tanacetum cinerariifolium]
MVVQSKLGEGSAMPTNPYYTPTILQSLSSQPQKTQKPKKPTRKATQVPQPSDPMEHVVDKAIHKELGDSLVRAATTASSLEVEQDIGNINKTQSKETSNESSSQGTGSGGSPRVESSDDEESLGEDASKQGRIEAIEANEDITLVNDQDDADRDMFDVNVLGGEEAKGIIFQEPGESTTTTTIPKQQSHDKAKKEQEANASLIEEWNDIQAKIDADYQLAERLQAQEQEDLSDAKKATLFQQFLEKRRKHFAAKRAEEKRNKPPIKSQQRKIMCTYLKNMEGYKLNGLKLKEFDSIKEMFDKTFRREKGLIIAALRDELRKLKGKALVDNAITTHTIAPEMLKFDVESLAPRLLNNKTAHSDYLRLTQEQAAILKEVVEQEKSLNPLNNSLDHACKYPKRIQEL